MGGAASVVRSGGEWARQESPVKIQHVLTIAGQPVLDNGRPAGAAHLPEGCGITICHGTGDDCMNAQQCTDMLQSDAAQGHARSWYHCEKVPRRTPWHLLNVQLADA